MNVVSHVKMENMDNLNADKKLSSSQLRKIKKPLIEKRRRERINESLSQLKSLILEALNKDESQYNKMEKADILELTVKHLKHLHKQPNVLPPPPAPVNQAILQPVQFQTTKENNPQDYKTGFVHCASEVQRYMQSVNIVKSDVKNHVINHLNSRVHDLASSPANNNENQENLTQQPIGATYVQILPKDTSTLTGSGECLASQVIQGIPCVQSIPVLNGQTILFASAVPNLATQQMQPVLQLAQSVITSTNLNQQSAVSPNYVTERPKQESGYESNMNSSVVNNRNNDTTNATYRHQEMNNAETFHSLNVQNNGRNNNSNLNVQPIKSSTQSRACTESNASSLSMNTYENRLTDQQTSFTNRNIINTLNFNHIQSTSNKEYRALESKQTHKSLVSDSVSPRNHFVYNNQFPKPQCLDPMWRPW